MTEGGDRDKLGRGCVWNGEIEPCLHQNHVYAVTTDPQHLSVHFLDYMTTSAVARNYFDYTQQRSYSFVFLFLQWKNNLRLSNI